MVLLLMQAANLLPSLDEAMPLHFNCTAADKRLAHVPPELVERMTPPFAMPPINLVPSAEEARQLGEKVELELFQVTPLSGEKNVPPLPPAAPTIFTPSAEEASAHQPIALALAAIHEAFVGLKKTPVTDCPSFCATRHPPLPPPETRTISPKKRLVVIGRVMVVKFVFNARYPESRTAWTVVPVTGI